MVSQLIRRDLPTATRSAPASYGADHGITAHKISAWASDTHTQRTTNSTLLVSVWPWILGDPDYSGKHRGVDRNRSKSLGQASTSMVWLAFTRALRLLDKLSRGFACPGADVTAFIEEMNGAAD